MNVAPEGTRERPATVLEFGSFRYEPKRWQVSDAAGPCRIGSRAIQLLDVLLESPGRLYSREELVARVWPDTIVEETSLRVQMSALRRLLGDDGEEAKFIANVPGRGYAFVAPVREVGLNLPAPRPPMPGGPGLMAPRSNLVGREAALAQLGELLDRERLVSVVGPVGVGKTSIALKAAAARHGHAVEAEVVRLADFAEISDPARAAQVLGRACGLELGAEEPLAAIEAALGQQQMLIVLDNCDRLVEWVAGCVARLMHRCPGLHFMITSSEPLEVEGEWVFRLAPLQFPDERDVIDTEALLAYPAVRLFVERAQAANATFELTRSNAAAVRQLCALLDGMPAALDLAAAQMGLCSVEQLVARRDQVLEVLTRGRRTAAARHRSLSASASWGFSLLNASEARALQHLSIFDGAFGLEEAVALLARRGGTPRQAVHDVMNLCTKSMILLEPETGACQRYRLLQVTRIFVALAAEPLPAIAPTPSTSTGQCFDGRNSKTQ